jgi:hypothetical protein
MPTWSFQAIVGTALTDATFRKDLLNGSRLRVLQSFDLTGEELEAIMAIRADSLDEFAGALHSLLLQFQGQRELAPLPHLSGHPSASRPRADSSLVYGCHSERSEESLAGLTRDPSLRSG